MLILSGLEDWNNTVHNYLCCFLCHLKCIIIHFMPSVFGMLLLWACTKLLELPVWDEYLGLGWSWPKGISRPEVQRNSCFFINIIIFWFYVWKIWDLKLKNINVHFALASNGTGFTILDIYRSQFDLVHKYKLHKCLSDRGRYHCILS